MHYVEIILLGFGLATDAFTVSVADGLIYKDINKKKALVIALTFGVLQALMPLIGYWLIELIETIVGQAGGTKAGRVMANIVVYISFGLLLFIGGKMLYEGIRELKKPKELKKDKLFSYKEVFIMGIATAIDALAAGVYLHSDVSNNIGVFLDVAIVLLITFVCCLLGVLLGKQIVKLLRGYLEVATIIGGVVLIGLAIWILLSHLL